MPYHFSAMQSNAHEMLLFHILYTLLKTDQQLKRFGVKKKKEGEIKQRWSGHCA
jgi:hypothetical protein